MIGQLKTLAYFKNEFGIGLLWLFKSRQIVSATVCFFTLIELLLPAPSRWPAANRTSCFQNQSCLCISMHTQKEKKKDFQQALNRNSPRRNEHGCDARLSAHGNPNCPPSLLAQLNGRCLALCSSGLLGIFWSNMWLFSRLERNGLFLPSCRHSSFSMSASLRGSFPPHFPLRRAVRGGVLLRSPARRHSLSL